MFTNYLVYSFMTVIDAILKDLIFINCFKMINNALKTLLIYILTIFSNADTLF